MRSGKDRRRGGTFSDGLCAPLRGKIYRAYFLHKFHSFIPNIPLDNRP
ncbi:hypothetical protein HMPREF9123_2881 [Neisseria bacilliformis ATCC BAA-1200]|uniref:Uncharacterized protein n=1 Tax=Neisseria bacilliformis ATCC BAA-1200 TaxID=888742 RepID=F2BGM4_9NEIS|nr:hypothetical protein HMPREF9123_2881 [Neisseria bacilliformis ATCC BAA-1200]